MAKAGSRFYGAISLLVGVLGEGSGVMSPEDGCAAGTFGGNSDTRSRVLCCAIGNADRELNDE